eukprot:TRINITY_DN12299_c0_g1_i1.p1 TRINITY_DN12299_c0_g1~~TRINITY_DN12299_c0_g1_i1.p1  ORF type:complete len:277 (+),score=41.20 TRINITY_DN12299_c0_g1_i1:87-917(+)
MVRMSSTAVAADSTASESARLAGQWLVKVTVRHGDFARSFSSIGKMEPSVEVYLGERCIGNVPPAYKSDTKPVWEFGFDAQEFSIGTELLMKVVHKRNWVRRETLIGFGKLSITADAVVRRATEHTVHVKKGPEHTGNVTVGLKFISCNAATYAPHAPAASSHPSMHLPRHRSVVLQASSVSSDVPRKLSKSGPAVAAVDNNERNAKKVDEKRNMLVEWQWWEIDVNTRIKQQRLWTPACRSYLRAHKLAFGSAAMCCAGGICGCICSLFVCITIF